MKILLNRTSAVTQKRNTEMGKHSKSISVEFEETLTDNDFGLIVCGKTGQLKGLWIPDGEEDKEVPQTIVDVCKAYFGIDPNVEETLH